MSGSIFQPSGDANWDRGLGTLAGALFPNPVGVAQAGYYGAEQRKAQIQSLQGVQEINAGNRAIRMLPGQQQPGPNQVQFYQPSGPNAPPIIAPSSSLPMVGANGQPLPPQQPSLGQTVAGGGQAPAAPPGGAPPPPAQVSPETLGNILAPGNEPHPKGFGATGTPPPASSPVPGAPPAPNTTASDGSVPNNDQGSGPLHYGGVTSPDGGQKYAPPAAPNGSPAPPNFDLGTYAALQASAGRNPEMAKVQILSYILDAEQRGVLPVGTAKSVQANADRLTASFGSPVYESNQATQRAGIAAGAGIAEANIGAQAQRDVANIAQTGATTREGMQPTTVASSDQPGAGPKIIPRSALPAAGAPGYSPETERIQNTPVKVLQIGPDGKPTGQTVTMSYGEARAKNLALTPESLDAVRATVVASAVGGGGTGPASQVRAAAMASEPPAAMTPQEQFNVHTQTTNNVQRLFAPGDDPFQRNLPAQLDPNAESDVNVRAQELFNQPGPTYHNASVAASTAMQELQATGHIPSKIDRGYQSLISNPGVREQVGTAQRPASSQYYIVPQLKQYKPGALGVAPAGMKDGDPVRAGNLLGVVRNGFVYPR